MRVVTIIVGLLLSGCLPWFGVASGGGGAFGTTSRGILVNGTALPKQGKHFRCYRGGDRQYAVPALAGAIERSSESVAEQYPSSVLLVGHISADTGGFISGHRSHRSGRDVDFGFYITDIYGRPAMGHPLMRFDRFGIGVRDMAGYRFDTKRNWALVEALLTDPEAEPQWIFVSNGLKALLLEWALDHDRDLKLIERAASVLRQPGDSAPHNDHFHVRVYCPRQSGARCLNTGPVWPWVQDRPSDMRYSRDELAQLALEGLTEGEDS